MGTILAVGAHHDDIEIRAGGTLAKYIDMGWKVIYAVACTTPYYFPSGAPLASNREVIDLRKSEARAGADVLGVTPDNVHFFDYRSLYWYKEGTYEVEYFDGINNGSTEFHRYMEELIPGRGLVVSAHRCKNEVQFLAKFIADQGCDIVLTHHPDDGHWEHYAVARLVFAALLAGSEAGRQVLGYAWDPGAAMPIIGSFAPTHFEDISATLERKCASLLCFPSQFADHDPTPFAVRARDQAGHYGRLAGLDFAEAFVPMNLQKKGVGMAGGISLPETYSLRKVRHSLSQP